MAAWDADRRRLLEHVLERDLEIRARDGRIAELEKEVAGYKAVAQLAKRLHG